MAKKKKQTLKKAVQYRKKMKRKYPLWKGPEVDGVTQSLLGRFLVCRERFRVMTIEGLGVEDRFSPALEYGSMWHVCEEAHAHGMDWVDPLLSYAKQLAQKYPTQQPDVEKWYQVCKVQFPIYVEYWSKHKDVQSRRAVAEEQVFSVPYTLPSGRVVRLRGMWDSVDMVQRGRSCVVVLQENKTKGDINEEGIRNRLLFDIQTGLYLAALDMEMHRKGSNLRDRLNGGRYKLGGVRYNVIRRPLSGGRGSIRPHKATKSKPAETMPEFYDRLRGVIKEEPEYYFMRWDVEYTSSDLERFRRQFLDPILEQLWDWYEWVVADGGDDPWRREHDSGRAANGVHFRYPYGVWNPMQNDRSDDLDEYVNTGSKVGLVAINSLFGELECQR